MTANPKTRKRVKPRKRKCFVLDAGDGVTVSVHGDPHMDKRAQEALIAIAHAAIAKDARRAR